jgi:hypothetical protein
MRKIVLKISDLIERLELGQVLGSIPKYVLVSLILIGGYLSFELNGNEEQYMLYAKQFMDPDWISSRYLNEFPGTRLLYQIIIGSFLNYLSFEKVVFIFKLLLCLFYAHSLSKIYKTLKISNVQILLHLPILFLFNQSMFAGSWMFISVEPKGFAYIFILYAFYHYIKAQFKWMALFLIIATYFHVLVGGYVFIFLFGSLIFLERQKVKFEVFKIAGFYVLAIIPLLFYIKTAISGQVEYSPSVDWIYSYFRSPHHTGIFRDMSYFYSRHFYGISISIIALWFSFYFCKINKDEQLNRVNNFILLSILGVLIAVVIAFFDREGILLKYYPFRINTMTTFALTLLLSAFVFSSFKPEYLKILTQITLLISILFLLRLYKPNVKNLVSYFAQNDKEALIDISNYIKENTPKDAVVLSFLGDLSVNRRMERDRFVVYKFIPAEMSKIPEWYERELFKRKMAGNIDHIKERKESYKIDYLLARNKTNSDLFELITSNKVYYLYKLK